MCGVSVMCVWCECDVCVWCVCECDVCDRHMGFEFFQISLSSVALCLRFYEKTDPHPNC